MDGNEMLKLADATDEIAGEIVAWAAKHQGPWGDEIYRANCQIAGAFSKLADRMRAIAKAAQEQAQGAGWPS